jgi:hypothetical protein
MVEKKFYNIDCWLLDTRPRRRRMSVRVPEPEISGSESFHRPNTTADSIAVQDDVVSQSTNNGSQDDKSTTASPVPEPEVPEPDVNSVSDNLTRISEPADETANRESGRPSKRRAASAVASFKEPSLNKKLRQGDNLTKDLKFRETKSRKTKSSGGKK